MVANTPLTFTRFQGDIHSGEDNGAPSLNTYASVRLQRFCTVSAASSANIMVPGDATNFEFKVIVTTPTSGANAADVRFGNINDTTHYCRFSCSAAGIYGTPNAISALSFITPNGADNLIVITASAGQEPAFQGRAIVVFSRGPKNG
jgi:hypothetical protein